MALERWLGRYLHHANGALMNMNAADRDFVLPPPRPQRRYLLYVHVPFCPALCPFCSFHRVEYREAKAAAYFDALRLQIRRYAEAGYALSGVYVGGGTPTVAPLQLQRTLELVHRAFGEQSVSVETNPSDLRPQVLDILRDCGVRRLSVGVQSFDDRLLRDMQRHDRYGSGSEIIARLEATRGRFGTLNVDMIFNLPRQSRASLERDLDILVERLAIDQVSFYPLMVAHTTRRAMVARMGEPTPGHEREFYRLIRQRLGPPYRPSSAWCFSRSGGMIDEYVVSDDEYLGAGSGAFGYLDGVFYCNTFSINRYERQCQAGRSPISMCRSASPLEQIRYDFLMRLFGLRLDKAFLRAKYGERYAWMLWRELAFFRSVGAVRDAGERYELTERGMYYWVTLMREFFTGVNRFREQARANIAHEYAAAGA